jgi:hypothetical protein
MFPWFIRATDTLPHQTITNKTRMNTALLDAFCLRLLVKGYRLIRRGKYTDDVYAVTVFPVTDWDVINCSKANVQFGIRLSKKNEEAVFLDFDFTNKEWRDTWNSKQNAVEMLEARLAQ